MIESHFEKVNNIASKCIIGVEYLYDSLPVRRFATLNADIIGNNVDYNYKDHDGTIYRFFDVVEKTWFEYPAELLQSYTYYGTNAAGLEDTIELYFLNDKDKIDIINNEVIKIINEFTAITDNLISDIVKYNKNYSKELFNKYAYLLFNKVLTYDEVLFSVSFNITFDEYKSDQIQNIDDFIKIFKGVIKVYEEKAITTIRGEMEENSLDEDEVEELELIATMVKDAVEESYVACQKLCEPWEILEEYPTILFPIPVFIEDERGDDSYTKSKKKIQEFLEQLDNDRS